MKETTKRSCELLIQNRERFKEVFGWESGLIWLAGAGVCTMKGKLAEEGALQRSKELLKQKVGVFSNFRGTMRVPTAAMLAASGNPEVVLDRGISVYERLKQDFFRSEYLPLTAMVIAQLAAPEEYEKIAVRTRALYKRMKEEHPILTSGEDSAFCAMLALSEKSDEMLITDMEKCYDILKPEFFSGNAVQSLSHVLALFEESAEHKCKKTMELFDSLKSAGRKYGTNYELPTLGVLAMTEAPVKEIVSEMMEIDDWLSGQKGFGFWGSVTGKQRLMYAGMLAQKDYVREETLQTAVVNSAVAMVIAQETVICAAVAASAAAAASASSS